MQLWRHGAARRRQGVSPRPPPKRPSVATLPRQRGRVRGGALRGRAERGASGLAGGRERPRCGTSAVRRRRSESRSRSLPPRPVWGITLTWGPKRLRAVGKRRRRGGAEREALCAELVCRVALESRSKQRGVGADRPHERRSRDSPRQWRHGRRPGIERLSLQSKDSKEGSATKRY